MEDTKKPQSIELYLEDDEQTQALAEQFAALMGPERGAHAGGRIHLKGDLGAGKTTFARALLRACGVTGRIKSPSYALLESYKVSNLYFYHLDFYRFSKAQDWEDAGFRDILQKQAVVLIEWPEQAGTQLPSPDIELTLIHADAGRQAQLVAYSEKGRTWLTSLILPLPRSARDAAGCLPPPRS
ncbi:tRNA (adenosine(37)-N6)-threonylcarbamoyltransferase complex ATPase subunit type 1 TsaE [Pusillimonas sp. CC-YST705]|uniref:tRNA threonylcarbamoyladenosine biosynthesis protein TsaE n=1 Tax=Mesopusillimonas faecipullorum TaxID=2755040 RepID=A0ABS8CEP0_9BURK|nr:tRNA (adenosine(37)-N6)-threonylcarbamoyltransferase complex ATPase subunit type 1 TsaE [Mesopusillimonas faecipullorum]MCB5364515.1 tRNA (adenosine(37)-N6)-threonylcarbamoyltransferase complex ATPase subunit type 1 TsaE [Mesopusillimonas faecipullorum]